MYAVVNPPVGMFQLTMVGLENAIMESHHHHLHHQNTLPHLPYSSHSHSHSHPHKLEVDEAFQEIGLNLTQPKKPPPQKGHCNGDASNPGSDCSTCTSCSTKQRLYLKGEKTELTMSEKEKLLECIKQHEVIYNPEHPSRSVRDLVTSAWEDVAEKTGFPVELCKEAWRKIKLAYQNSQRHARSKVNADGSIRKPYYLHKQMTFYEPHLRARDVMNQLVKVDQQAAQERNQKIHQTSISSTSVSPQPLNLQSFNSMSSPESILSQKSMEECSSPLALDSRVSVIESNPGESGLISSSVSPSSTPQPLLSMVSPAENTSKLEIEEKEKKPDERQLKRKLEQPDYYFQPTPQSPSKQPATSGTMNGHVNSSLDFEPVMSSKRNSPSEVPPPPLEVDADLQFLLSLHADIKSLSFRQKFGFKRKVYALMEDILNGSE